VDLYADDFLNELDSILEQAQTCGFVAVEVNAGNLHRRLGGYPGLDDRMPLCCDVMRQAMRVGDVVVTEPSKDRDADLTIRYRLPR
jgi:hypothetical protein